MKSDLPDEGESVERCAICGTTDVTGQYGYRVSYLSEEDLIDHRFECDPVCESCYTTAESRWAETAKDMMD